MGKKAKRLSMQAPGVDVEEKSISTKVLKSEDVGPVERKELSVPDVQEPKKKKGKGGDGYELTLEKQELEVEKLKEEIEKLQHTNAKLAGDNIPTALVREVFIRHNKNFISSFKNGVENWIMEIEKKYSLKREDTAKMRGQLIKVVNESGSTAHDETKKEIGNIVQQTKIKKGVGERL